MPEFKNIQGELQQAKKSRVESERRLFLAKEQLNKLEQEKEQLLRRDDVKSEAYQKLITRETDLNSIFESAGATYTEIVNLNTELLNSFQLFTDPRENISQFSDEYPVFLFPVRLETRFKKVDKIGEGIQPQLWVRIFPDDCSVDTFEDTLSVAEVQRAQNYWLSTWTAGKSGDTAIQAFIEDQKRAAWKGLTGSIQAGRAYWITQNYIPENIQSLPERTSEQEVILTIATEELPGAATQAALTTYWADVWLANGDADQSNTAFVQLMSTLTIDKNDALDLVGTNVPFNFKDATPPTELPRPSVKVTFIVFKKSEDLDTKLSSWSQAAKVTSLPDKFILMGYKGKDSNGKPIEVLNELGQNIPDPLTVGLNPSLDTSAVLKEAMVEDFMTQTTNGLKTQKLTTYYDDLKDAIKAEKTLQTFIDDFQLLADEPAMIAGLEQIFDDLKDETKAAKYIDYLSQKSETKWLFDFDEAVKVGMGFKVDVSAEVYNAGFDRLFVLGTKMSVDETGGKEAIEELIQHHHYGSNGFSIMPQGTPTNNTEDGSSGYSESEDPDKTFDRYILDSSEDDPDDSMTRKDGKWLTTLLGIDATKSSIDLSENYYQTDQREAKAMHTAMWSGTMRYFMESMMTPVFSETDEKVTHAFFTKHVSGRGSIPAIRIGDQPYGIIATNTISNQKWLFQNKNILSSSSLANDLSTLQKMNVVINKIREDFMELSDQVAFVGKEGDAHQILLEAIGLHASSVEFHQRNAKSFDHLYNFWSFIRTYSLYNIYTEEGYEDRGLDLLQKLDHDRSNGQEDIPILQKFFLSASNLLKGDLIDDQPLSEVNPIRAYTSPVIAGEAGENYIHWLIENTLLDHDKIKKQQGFADGAPNALLYKMLHHAIDLEFSNTALDLFRSTGQLSKREVMAAKVDANFIGIKEQPTIVESKYDYLSAPLANQNVTAAQHITALLQSGTASVNTLRLKEMVEALKLLKDAPTARLERVFAEHLDCCTYRLDAWLLGFVNLQLAQMRQPVSEGGEQNTKKGIYIGAYGWVENLKPDNEILEPVTLDADLRAVFDPNDENEIVKDSSNAGYIHAPSINQATTAAVLRNAYISSATSDDPEIYKVNLSSERVRMAQGIIEGMQQGQSLGALLGYQLERGLHDRYQEAEVDSFIYELRKAFPLIANRLQDTSEENGIESITQIEARNVVDGLALVNHIINAQNNADKVYPFGKDLAQANTNEANVINSEVDRILNINDALADLATAEGIHHAIQANYERAAATLGTYSKGDFPQTPEVTRTPRSGVTLTNRTAIHLKASSIAPAGANPRVVAEPAINDLISDFLPALTDICCLVSYRIPSYEEGVINLEQEVMVSMDQLGLSPIDLFYLLDVGSDKNLTALDDYLLKHVYESETPRLDATIEIKYTAPIAGKVTVFELASLINSLRTLLLAARPLKVSDILLPNEVDATIDANGTIDLSRVTAAFEQLKTNFVDNTDSSSGIDLVNDTFIALIIEDDFEKTLTDNKSRIISEIDNYITLFLNRLHSLSQFGTAQTGFGFIYDRKASIYAAIYEKVLGYKKRWEEKQTKYDGFVVDAGAASTDEEKLDLLRKAERSISTSNTTILSPDPDTIIDFETMLIVKRASFDSKLLEINDWLNGSHLQLATLVGELNKLKSGVGSVTGQALSEFDLLGIETEADERQIIVLAEDLKTQAVKLNTTLIATAANVQGLFDQHALEAASDKQIDLLSEVGKQLFGEDFKIIPSFQLTTGQASELTKCLNATGQLLDYQKNQEASDFPVDDWLYGVGRVRDKLGHWENAVVLSEGFTGKDKDLTPVQLPYKEHDSWLALSYPDSYEIESDKLLYTAYLNGFDPTQRLCGLLFDEWTEVIPAKKETTGLSFQYDQPNAEPPQSMLLVTPSEFTGQWDWQDMVDAMHETLDIAKLRAVEPQHIDKTAYAQFLPATVSAVTAMPLITIGLNYGLNNDLNYNNNG